MDRLHLINVFVAVVDSAGFTGAARKLNISPPAVTRAINELESHLGVRLLTRTTRVVRVTEYLTRHPQVSASCWFMDRIVNMMDEGVGVAVRIGELPDSSMQAVRVGRVRRVICAAPSYLEKHGIPQTPDDLAAHCIVLASAVTPAAGWRLMDQGELRIVKLHARLSTTSNDSAVAAAVSGFGLTRLLSYQVADALRDGRLKNVLTEYEPDELPVHLVHREGRHASQKARAFLDLALERLRANPALH